MNKTEIERAASALDEAEHSRVQIRMLTLEHPAMNMDDAYAVQAAWIARKIAAGRTVKGWKIGLTSKAMQSALNIDIPDSGVLLDDMFFDDGATIPGNRFIQPCVARGVSREVDLDQAGALHHAPLALLRLRGAGLADDGGAHERRRD